MKPEVSTRSKKLTEEKKDLGSLVVSYLEFAAAIKLSNRSLIGTQGKIKRFQRTFSKYYYLVPDVV